MNLNFSESTAQLRLLADSSRLRLLLLLEEQELTAAELTDVTGLAQSRISTHLARLKRAGLIVQRRSGGSALYAISESPAVFTGALWQLLRQRLNDRQSQLDAERAAQLVRARSRGQTWAESVAGRMELQYSPGRSWEATARTLISLLKLGDTLDIAAGDGVLAELIAGHAKSVTCVDISATLIAAAKKRLHAFHNVSFVEADMHDIPLKSGGYDQVFVMHALAYSQKPQQVLKEAARLLKSGGRLVIAALNQHTHKVAMEAYDHVNLGITPTALSRMLQSAGLKAESCQVSSREQRPPYFEVITALARK
ncbi:MAG: metalloregulator ArsR/SmtB family transcription factor [Pseudomonadota bacterium]